MNKIQARKRLEEIRESLNNEDISYGELAELASLAEYIKPGDVQLLEAAGVLEFPGMGDVRVFDNEGETVDRYTVFIPNANKWDVYTMSLNALNPDGINMYSHTVDRVEDALSDKDREVQEIPFDVREAIKERLEA